MAIERSWDMEIDIDGNRLLLLRAKIPCNDCRECGNFWTHEIVYIDYLKLVFIQVCCLI